MVQYWARTWDVYSIAESQPHEPPILVVIPWYIRVVGDEGLRPGLASRVADTIIEHRSHVRAWSLLLHLLNRTQGCTHLQCCMLVSSKSIHTQKCVWLKRIDIVNSKRCIECEGHAVPTDECKTLVSAVWAKWTKFQLTHPILVLSCIWYILEEAEQYNIAKHVIPLKNFF